MGGDGDDEFGMLFGGERGGVFARSEELGVEIGRGFLEMGEEGGVEPGEGFAVVEILKGEAEGQSKGAVTHFFTFFTRRCLRLAGPYPLV